MGEHIVSYEGEKKCATTPYRASPRPRQYFAFEVGHVFHVRNAEHLVVDKNGPNQTEHALGVSVDHVGRADVHNFHVLRLLGGSGKEEDREKGMKCDKELRHTQNAE